MTTGQVNRATAAGTATIGCGAILTQSTTLTADVGPCNSGDALRVGTSGITVDLAGHRVFSTAPLPRSSGTGPDGRPVPDDSVGIHLQQVSGVAVRGGTVEGFSAGVAIEGGGGNTVSSMIVQHNLAPCLQEGEVTPTQLPGKFGDGIVMFSSSNNRVQGNLVQSNGPFSGVSIVTETDPVTARVDGPLPSGNVVSGNLVRDHAACRAEMGIRVEGPGATNNTVSGNSVDGSDVEGIAVLATFNIDLSVPNCNAFPDDPPGPDTCPTFNPPQPQNSHNLISGNHVTHASMHGPTRAGIGLLNFFPYLGSSGQPSSLGADNNTVRGNLVERNFGNGIAVNSHGNSILDNVSENNNQAGCPRPSRIQPPGTPNAAPTCFFAPFGGPYGPRFDLLDNTAVNMVPKSLPPPPPPFEVMFVVAPGRPPCDSNTWSGNTYGTAFPTCTTANGRQVPAASPMPLPGLAAESGSAAVVVLPNARPLLPVSGRMSG
ncbi:MAG: right-handed parallel beta-helix repeat-containing protein [Actinomycetota bacterium]|nr:right-handed parallel beta-helix repeat-containing protein [Actinomycetota bacterium]